MLLISNTSSILHNSLFVSISSSWSFLYCSVEYVPVLRRDGRTSLVTHLLNSLAISSFDPKIREYISDSGITIVDWETHLLSMRVRFVPPSVWSRIALFVLVYQRAFAMSLATKNNSQSTESVRTVLLANTKGTISDIKKRLGGNTRVLRNLYYTLTSKLQDFWLQPLYLCR